MHPAMWPILQVAPLNAIVSLAYALGWVSHVSCIGALGVTTVVVLHRAWLWRGVLWVDVATVAALAVAWALPWIGVAVTAVVAVLAVALPPRCAQLMVPACPVATRDVHVPGDGCLARVFYRCQAGGGDGSVPTRYMAPGIPQRRGFARFVGLPVAVFAHLGVVRTHTWAREPPLVEDASERKPLVLFAHGLGGVRSTYSSLCAAMAAKGYVVVACESRDGTACATRLSDGRVTFYRKPSAAELAASPEAYHVRNAQLRHRVRETNALLHVLRTSDGDDLDWVRMLRRISDVNRIFVVGHSFGGGQVIEECQEVTGVLGGIAMDPWLLPLSPGVAQGANGVPVVCLNTEWQWEANLERERTMRGHEGNQAPFLMTTVVGTRHQNVSDFPLFAPTLSRVMNDAGALPPEQGIAAFATLAVAFMQVCDQGVIPDAPTLMRVLRDCNVQLKWDM